jgi:hypothetical protein
MVKGCLLHEAEYLKLFAPPPPGIYFVESGERQKEIIIDRKYNEFSYRCKHSSKYRSRLRITSTR